MTTRFAVTAGWTRSAVIADIGGGQLRALFYEDGTIRLEHKCKVVDGEQFIVAPALDDHTVESVDPLTVSPSVLCPDCSLHGFIRDGRWQPA